jgi:hypothetical protein
MAAFAVRFGKACASRFAVVHRNHVLLGIPLKRSVDRIRTRGNQANHEIELMSAQDANELISLSAMLLRLIYEFPASVQSS